MYVKWSFFVAIASYRRWSHIRHRNEWVMVTIECRSSPDFEPISPTVYIRVSSLFEIRTTSYWVQHTPKCHFCRSCRDTTEDENHFTIISRWRVIKTIKIFPCRNILTSVIDVSWKLRGKIFTVKRKHFTTLISKLFPVDPKIQFLEFLLLRDTTKGVKHLEITSQSRLRRVLFPKSE